MDNATNGTFANGTFANGTFTNGTFTGFTPTPKPFWSGLLFSLAYIVILIGSLYSFSSVYRQRQASHAAKLEPWFGQHVTRNIYLSLLHLDPAEASASEGTEKKLSKVPDSILKAALLKRAVEDIQRIVQLRQAKPALQTLLQRGSVGDELWRRFQRAEQDMELEVKDVVEEANAYAPGWGQVIFQSANEINQNILIKKRTGEIGAQLAGEKSWWEEKRAGIQSSFMKELEGETASEPVAAPATPKKVVSEGDDDAVLVEAGGPAQAQGSAKKKKGGKK